MNNVVLTSYNPKQHLNSIHGGIKIGMSVDGFSIFDVTKQNVASQCITSDHEEHQHDDEEAFVDGHDHSLDQHSKRGMFS